MKHALYLYEEIMLLALRDEEGTVSAERVEFAIASAILAELLLRQHILVDDTRKKQISVLNGIPLGDPLIDECLNLISEDKKERSLKHWVSRLAQIKNLRHKAAKQVCKRKILRADEDQILYIFKRRIYPEIDPIPERQIITRLEHAIFTDSEPLAPGTIVLISLAESIDLLSQTFGRKKLKPYRKRIDDIINGELTGKAAKEIIAACNAAIMIAVIMPTIMASN